MRLALFCTMAMIAGQASAQQIDCKNAVDIAKTAGVFVQAINGIVDACKGQVNQNPACQTFADQAKQTALAESLAAFSAQTLLLALKCPGQK